MFKQFLEALKALFSSLLGGGGSPNKPETTSPRPDPIEPVVVDPAEDGSEVKPDSVVVVLDETIPVVFEDTDPSEEFDEDIFDDPTPNTETDPTPEPDVPTGPIVLPDIPTVDIEVEVEVDETSDTPQPEEPDTPPSTTTDNGHVARYLWCLDNGHGSLTAGKRSPVFDDGETQLLEYEFNRAIVKLIIEKLEPIGVQYFNVVPEVEVGDILRERVQRANIKTSSLPKIFLSIHSNAAPAANSKSWAANHVSGIETWFYHNSRKGRKLASVFQQHLIDTLAWKNRHIKSRPNGQFYVLRKTRMPAVLTENGFYNNKAQAKELMKPEIREKIAQAHVDAILSIEKSGL